MIVIRPFLVILTAILTERASGQQQVLIPAPNGTYTVGLTITQLVDEALLQPFAPVAEPRAFELSVFYPTSSTQTAHVLYMPPETARYEDLEQSSSMYGLNTPNGTFEKLMLQLAPNGSSIAPAAENGQWPVLLFMGAGGTTRLFYSAICSQVASTGYVVVSIDTPYDTDIVQYSDGNIILFNSSLTESAADATADVNARSQDASFVLDQLTNSSFASSLIPHCTNCLKTTHVGIFGHSVGGATAATVMVNDTRFAGGLNYDGALWGDVVNTGFSQPFMLMTSQGQTRVSQNQPDDPNSSWFQIWPKLTGPKFDLILNNSLHYTFSDLPIVLQLLGLHPNATVLNNELLTTMNGIRALHIVTTYTTAFFDFVLGGKSEEMLSQPSAMFPEITIDNGANSSSSSGASNATTSSGANSLVGLTGGMWPGLAWIVVGTAVGLHFL